MAEVVPAPAAAGAPAVAGRMVRLVEFVTLAVALALGLYVVVDTAILVARMWSPTPHYDFWAFVEQARAWSQGDYPITRLWEQHNEHRILFPRLVFFADYWLFAGRQVLELVVIGLNQLLLALLLWRLAGGILKGAVHGAYLGLALAATFSSVQYENLIMPFQVQFVGVLLAAAVGFWALEPGRERTVVFVLALAALLVASFSMANGILVWPISLGLAFRLRFARGRIIAIAVLGALATWGYLHGYHSPAHHAPIGTALAKPLPVLAYFLAYLGNPWQALGLERAIAFGAFALLCLLVTTWNTLRRRTPLPVGEAALLAIAWFVVGTAALTALGRVSFELPSALLSRYASPAILLWLVVAARLAGAVAQRLAVTAVLLALPVLAIAWWQSRFPVHAPTIRTQIDRGTLGLLMESTDDELMRCLYPRSEPVIELGAVLRAHRWSTFADGWQDLVGLPLADRYTVGAGSVPGGVFSAESIADNGDLVALRGWSHASHPIRHLVLTDEAGLIRGLGLGGFGYELGKARELPPETGPTVEWQALVYVPEPKDRRLRVYAVEATRGRAQPIGDWHPISPYRTVRANRIGTPLEPATATRFVTTFGAGTFPAGAEPPKVPWPWWCSFVHGDHDVGRFALGPITVPADGTVVIPYITGPASDGLKLNLLDAQSGAVLAAAMPMMPAPLEWHGWTVRLPATAPHSVVVVAEDQGTAWGQWLAVGPPCALLPPPESPPR